MSLFAQEIAAVKDDAEKDLAAAKPALDAALSALNSITPKDIVALKALKNPPDIVKRIFDCVLLLRCAACRCNLQPRILNINSETKVLLLVGAPLSARHGTNSFDALMTLPSADRRSL